MLAGDKNYPWKTRSTSTYDLALNDGTGDAEYLALLRDWLPRLFAEHRPQLVFFQAGVDAMVRDSFGRSSCSFAACRYQSHHAQQCFMLLCSYWHDSYHQLFG